jgi:hypothetical protein
VAHYLSLPSRRLAEILIADGWIVEWHRAGEAEFVKPNHQSISITLNYPASLKRVRSVCANAKLTAERFEELYRTAPTIEAF